MKCHAVLLCVLALHLHQGEALKCHTCQSATDTKCADPIDSSLATTQCTPDIFKQGASYLNSAADLLSSTLGKLGVDANIPNVDANTAFTCFKSVKQEGDKRLVVRGCGLPKTEKFDMCQQMKASGGIVTFCEVCDTDGCNGASGVLPSALLMLVAALAVLMTVFKQ